MPHDNHKASTETTHELADDAGFIAAYMERVGCRIEGCCEPGIACHFDFIEKTIIRQWLCVDHAASLGYCIGCGVFVTMRRDAPAYCEICRAESFNRARPDTERLGD